MTVTLFISLLTVFAAVTSACVEALKKVLSEKNVKYAANALVCVVAAIVGIGGTAAYYALFNIAYTLSNCVCMVLMGLAVAVGSMIGYDKVVQMIQQFKVNKL